jgi:hypothetical protein
MRTLDVIEHELKAAFAVQDPLVTQLNDAVRASHQGRPPLSTSEYDALKARVDEARGAVQKLIQERKRTRAAVRGGSTPEQIAGAIELLKRSGFVVVHGRAE